ncbi:uncharacterized protein [Dysidea avara]|uniref:uncharacterized protein isoform X2 n=1 Tax=Dysidea avara TaxID=196820 RepID=UPI0033259DEF
MNTGHVLKSIRGIVEMILRALCLMLCMALVACAFVAYHDILDVEGFYDTFGGEYEDSGLYTSGAIALVVMGALGMTLEITMMIIRLLNPKWHHRYFLYFGITDIVLTVLLMLCLFAGGVANAKYANDNDNFLDERRSFCDDNPEQDYTCDDIETVRNYEAISAVKKCMKVTTSLYWPARFDFHFIQGQPCCE